MHSAIIPGVHIKTRNNGDISGVDITQHDGKPIGNVTRAVVTLDAGADPVATIEVYLPDVDVVADAELFTTLPDGKRYRLVPVDETPVEVKNLDHLVTHQPITDAPMFIDVDANAIGTWRALDNGTMGKHETRRANVAG